MITKSKMKLPLSSSVLTSICTSRKRYGACVMMHDSSSPLPCVEHLTTVRAIDNDHPIWRVKTSKLINLALWSDIRRSTLFQCLFLNRSQGAQEHILAVACASPSSFSLFSISKETIRDQRSHLKRAPTKVMELSTKFNKRKLTLWKKKTLCK